MNDLGRRFSSWLTRAECNTTQTFEIYEPINHGVSMAFQLRLRSEVVGDAEQATASWCKRGYGRNERVAGLGKAESTKPDLADRLSGSSSGCSFDYLAAHLVIWLLVWLLVWLLIWLLIW